MKGEFYFINETNHQITYAIGGFEKFNIAPKSSILVKEIQDGSEDVKPSYYHSPFINRVVGNSLIVVFDSNRCLETFNSSHSPLSLENYSNEKIGERTYKFTYTFTQADYTNAVNCP